MSTAIAYDRPVRVRGRFGNVAQVQWLDNNTMGYVPVADLGGYADE